MSRGTFYTTEKIGPKQSLTPEGFLLCEEVPVARSGMMIYGPDETPIEAGPDGVVKIYRDSEDIFRPETIASAQGKPVTNDHPDEDVVPESWKELAEGIAMNVRRGEGAMDDLLIADLLVTTPESIRLIQEGKREISLGYEADYDEVSPGVGKQSNLIINHIALVEQGRCGPRCAISDRKPTLNEGDSSMATKDKKHSRLVNMMMKAFKAKDADEVEQLAKQVAEDSDFDNPDSIDNPGSGDTHIHIHAGGPSGAVVSEGTSDEGEDDGDTEGKRVSFTDDDFQAHVDKNEAEHQEMRARIEALEKALAGSTSDDDGDADGTSDDADPELKAALQDEAPDGVDPEQAVKAKDSMYLADSFQDTVAMAEILAPGIRIPTFDQKARPGQSFKKICGLRRQALDLAYVQPATRSLLDELLAGKDLDTKHMTCDAVRSLFRSAASMKRTMNNTGARGNTADLGVQKKAGVKTLAELNALNASRWNK